MRTSKPLTDTWANLLRCMYPGLRRSLESLVELARHVAEKISDTNKDWQEWGCCCWPGV